MATRDTKFLLKRSNVPGKIPPSSAMTEGEIALNTADAILYTSGSTQGQILPIGWDRVHRTGDTMTGTLFVPTISAATYQNLPTDIRVTGGTYSNGTTTFTNNTGGTFNVTGYFTGYTNVVNTLTTGTGLSANTTSGDITIINSSPDQTVVLNNGSNISVTGTYPNFTINATDTNRFVTGYSYNNNIFTISDNSGSTYTATINSVTGLTINGNLTITGTTSSGTISATTYQNLPTDIRITGGTYSAGTATFTNNTGGTFNVTGFTTGGTSSSYWQYRKTYNSFHATAGLSGAANALAISANVLFAFPIEVKRDVTISSLVIGNVGASAGNSVWGVYDSLNGEPNNLIFQTTAFNNAVTGAVSYTISPTQSLTTGIYWVVYHSSSTPTLRVMQVANSVPNIIGENGSLFNGSMTYLFRNLAYSGTLPNPFGATSLPSTISLIPFVQFGVTY